ncbi:lytic transglycosylase domain-containing protein [Agromyces sp. MMS24-K17]|uniref:aggregation-promoting factor C-terminal-like domain-containing protein n=1 Tax=Agromyces sp. MMS24-K17 TaxID=3372850 RepID=UPI0037543A2E
MQNQNPELPSTTHAVDVQPTRGDVTRSRRDRRHRRGFLFAATAVVALGAVTGSGFVLQSALAAEQDRVAETDALRTAANADTTQAVAHSAVLDAQAARAAKLALSGANDTLTAAQGKVDASGLAATVANLDDYVRLSPARVFALAKATGEQTEAVKGQVAEFDRVAAEQAAAAAAAAQAAAQAAVEQAAAKQPSAASRPSAPSNPSEAQAIARDLMLSMYGWGDDQFGCLVSLWSHESGWNVYAENRSSGAYGIPQALPGSKMAVYGDDWQSNPATQIKWGLGYISGRYGTPCGAWDSFSAKGWY